MSLAAGSQTEFAKLWLGYTESLGHPGLRKEIAQLYQSVNPDQILVHAGAEEAIFNFANVALSSGDHVIVHWPCYQSLSDVALSLGCEVTRWEAEESEGWALDPSALKKSLRPNTKAVIINSPHNPTGYLMDKSRWDEVIEIARKHGLWLFADEVYRGLEYQEEDRLPAACDLYEKSVSLGVLSKSFGLPGLRIGWLATKDSDLFSKLASFKDYTTICNSAPSEWLSTLALKHKEKILSENRAVALQNLDRLRSFFIRHVDSFDWVEPKAGCIAFPRLKSGGSEAFCEALVKRDGVLLIPSCHFNFGDDHLRIGYGRKNFTEALGVLEKSFLKLRLG